MLIGAAEVFAKCSGAPCIKKINNHSSLGQIQRRLYRVGESIGNIFTNDHSIDDHANVMLE